MTTATLHHSQPTAQVILDIPLELIEPNPYQPRRVFSPLELTELATSLREHGVLQNIVVRRAPIRHDGREGYILIAGERRWRAAQMAELRVIPALIKDVSEIQSGLLALTENVQRVDVTALDEALAIARLMKAADERGQKITVMQIAHACGKNSAGWVNNRLALLNCSADVQEMVVRHPETMSHALTIEPIKDAEFRGELIAATVDGASVRAIEKQIRDFKEARHWKGESYRAPDATTQIALDDQITRDDAEYRVLDALDALDLYLKELGDAWRHLQQSQRKQLKTRLETQQSALAVLPRD